MQIERQSSERLRGSPMVTLLARNCVPSLFYVSGVFVCF